MFTLSFLFAHLGSNTHCKMSLKQKLLPLYSSEKSVMNDICLLLV